MPVAIGVLVDRAAEPMKILLSKRPDDKVLGGLWEFPGGKLEEGVKLISQILQKVACPVMFVRGKTEV